MLGRQTDMGGISHLGQELDKTGLGVDDGLCGLEGNHCPQNAVRY